ncbi:hypothetical protein [Pseudorhizobium marinum]|uniref:hypothetical protein n=1 Tax=Pseudorhizobium marinum TaxID=1496690 RepID=UPI0004954A7A|nr:hypothetical protein [Pseudorhizobium marinum]
MAFSLETLNIFLPDIIDLTCVCILVACLFNKASRSLSAFVIYNLGMGIIEQTYEPKVPGYELVARLILFLVFCAINYKLNKYIVRKLTKINGTEINFLRIDASDPRFLTVMRLWVFTLLVTWAMYRTMQYGAAFVTDDFYVSWSVNVAFFTVIGFAVALVSMRLPQHEEFKDRVGFLFAAKVEADPDLRSSALDHLSEEIKKIGFVSSNTQRKITVVEYSAAYGAYRAYVTVHTTLVNLFGDVEARDDTNFQITPDEFDENNRPPVIGQVVSLVVDGDEKIRNGPVNITDSNEGSLKENFTVGRTQKSFTFKYWAWFRFEIPASYTSKRFCRSFTVTLVNRMKSDPKGEVRVQSMKNAAQMPTILRYNESAVIDDIKNMAPNKEYECFKFLKPDSSTS